MQLNLEETIKDLSCRVALLSPVITRELYSKMSGMRMEQIKGQAFRRNLPTYKIGKHSLVNVAKLSSPVWSDSYVLVPTPTMNAAAFSDACGFTVEQTEEQIRLRNIPIIKIGRLIHVDMSELFRRCLTPTLVK